MTYEKKPATIEAVGDCRSCIPKEVIYGQERAGIVIFFIMASTGKIPESNVLVELSKTDCTVHCNYRYSIMPGSYLERNFCDYGTARNNQQVNGLVKLLDQQDTE